MRSKQHGVLVFPGIGLNDAEQLASPNASASAVLPASASPAARPSRARCSRSPRSERPSRSEYVKVSFFWHIDGLVADAPIPKAALLTARTVSSKGGQTEFANTYAAYEALPEARSRRSRSRRGPHAVAGFRWVVEAPTDNDRARWARMRSSATIRWSGAMRTAQVADGQRDRGSCRRQPAAEGGAPLMRLTEWAVQPIFTYRHEWHEGDLVIWSNHGVLHRVIPYGEYSGRSMDRTSIDGALVAEAL